MRDFGDRSQGNYRYAPPCLESDGRQYIYTWTIGAPESKLPEAPDGPFETAES